MDEPKPKSGFRKLKKKVSKAFSLSRDSSSSVAASQASELVSARSGAASAQHASLASPTELHSLLDEMDSPLRDSCMHSPDGGPAPSEVRSLSPLHSAELRRLQQENAELLENLKASQAVVAGLQGSAAELQSKADVGQELSSAATKVLGDLTEQTSQLAAENSRLTAELEGRQAELEALRATSAAVQLQEAALVQEANEEVFRVQEELAGAQAALEAGTAREAALARQVADARDELTAVVTAREALLSAAEAQAQFTATQLAEAQLKMDGMEAENSALQVALATMQATLAAAEGALAERDAELDRLAVLEGEAKAARMRAAAELQTAVADSAQEMDRLAAELESTRRDKRLALEAVEGARATAATAAEKAAAAERSLREQLEETVREAEAALEELQAEATAELEALQGKLESAEETGSKLLRQAAAATAARETALAAAARAQSELETLKPKAADTAQQLASLTAAALEHERQLAALHGELSVARGEIAGLKAEIADAHDRSAAAEAAAADAARERARAEAQAREESSARKRAETAHAAALLEVIELTGAEEAAACARDEARSISIEAQRSVQDLSSRLLRADAKRAGLENELAQMRGRMARLLGAGGVLSGSDDEGLAILSGRSTEPAEEMGGGRASGAGLDDEVGEILVGSPSKKVQAPAASTFEKLADAEAGAEDSGADDSEEESSDASDDACIAAVRPAASAPLLRRQLPPLPLAARQRAGVKTGLLTSNVSGDQPDGGDDGGVAQDGVKQHVGSQDDVESEPLAQDSKALLGRRSHPLAGLGLKLAVSVGMAALGAAVTLHGGAGPTHASATAKTPGRRTSAAPVRPQRQSGSEMPVGVRP